MQESFEQSTALQTLAYAPGAVLHARYRIVRALRLCGDDLHYAAEDQQTGTQVLLTEYVPQALVFRREGTLYCRSEEAKTTLRQEVGRRLTFYRKLLPIAQTTVLDLSDVFVEGGTCCTVSQTNGTPLSAMIESGKRLPAARALALLSPVTDCLRAIHAAGLFHGAVDPYHILTDGTRVTALTGLAYPPVPASTPFDAPEKNAGLYECSAATDVYAVGALLCQLLTGFPPESAAQRQSGRALTLPDDLPPQMRAVLTEALAQDPHDRFPDVDQMLAALEDAPAAAPQKKKRDGRELLRRVVMLAAILTLLILFLIGLFGSRCFVALVLAGSAAVRGELMTALPPEEGGIHDPRCFGRLVMWILTAAFGVIGAWFHPVATALCAAAVLLAVWRIGVRRAADPGLNLNEALWIEAATEAALLISCFLWTVR